MKNMIIVTPRATEKAYAQSKGNIYVFDAPLAANKQDIVDAVETQYKVKVTNIKTLIQNGKAVRFSKGKRQQPGNTVRKSNKKAYVTLADGDSIKVFDEVNEAADKAKTEKEKK